MVQITERASQRVRQFLAERESDSAIRFHLVGDCSNTVLRLMMDQEQPDDTCLDHEGVRYVINRKLLKRAGRLELDYTTIEGQTGFVVSSEHELPGNGCQHCGAC